MLLKFSKVVILVIMFVIYSSLFCIGHNYAINKHTSQSSTAGSLTSNIAVDGVTTIGIYSHTGFNSNEWWKVDLGETILFQYARIFPRSERTCDDEPSKLCGKTVGWLTSWGCTKTKYLFKFTVDVFNTVFTHYCCMLKILFQAAYSNIA